MAAFPVGDLAVVFFRWRRAQHRRDCRLGIGDRIIGDGVTFRRIGVSLGAEVGGIDLRRPLSEASYQALHDGLAEHELLVLHDQDIISEQLITFGERFGTLSVHPFAPRDEEAHALIKFTNDADNPPWGTDVWHSDETFRAAPPMATALCAKEVPDIGGDTVFASMTAAYDGLSERMKRFISGLEAVHDFKPFRALFGDSKKDHETLRHFESLYPLATHPVVRLHPVTGRKVLFVNPQFTIRIKNMDERESRALLETLFAQALIPEFQYRHHWRPNTIAFWDNRSVQHYAVHDYYPQRRFMERVTIAGEPPVGVEAADPATVQRAKQAMYHASRGIGAVGGHRPHLERDKRR